MAILLALCSATVYGFADFSGGLASRRADPVAVTGAAQVAGLLLTPVLLVLLASPYSSEGVLVGAGAGVFGGLGLVLYFTALRDGAMGVVSPLSAAAAAGVPVAIGLGAGERPGPLALLGIAIALPAIYLAARPVATSIQRAPGLPPGVGLGLASGLAFGLFFALLDQAPDDSAAWPLLGSKLGSVGILMLLSLARRRTMVPARPAWRLVALSGALDMTANMLFLLATRRGLLSLVSVVASQYPVVVVLLSVVVLRERLAVPQRIGIGMALLAVGLVGLS